MERRRQQKNNKGAPKWMVTFSDMMTLILVFFVMLFSMSVVDAQKFRALSESFQGREVFNFDPSMIPLEDPFEGEDGENQQELLDPIEENNQDDIDEGERLDKLLAEVRAYLESHDLNDFITAMREDRGVVLVLQDRILFETAEAEVLPSAEPFLNKVGKLLESIPNIVEIEGHTDGRPISTYRFPSNWELSGARASSVIRYFLDNNNIEPNRFIATGYGETRPVAPNTSEANLQKNRRVVIVISDPTYEPVDTNNIIVE